MTLTPATKVTVLKHLINGRETDFITAAVGISESQVAEVKRDHGYPDEKKMQWAVDILQKKADEIPTGTAPPRGAAARPTPPRSLTAAPVVRTAPPVAEQRPGHSVFAELLDRASESNKAATRRLGEKINTLVSDLKERLAGEERARAVKASQERAAAKKAERIAELEAELAKLKGKGAARVATPKPSADGPDAKTIRSWAAETDIPCPASGRVPGAVREQYLAAHEERAS